MQRPPVITTLGILNLVIAAWQLFGMFAAAGFLAVADHLSASPIFQHVHRLPAQKLLLECMIPFSLLSCGMLCAAGIGLLKMRPWARTLSIAYGIYGILLTITTTVLNFIYVARPMMEQAGAQNGPESAAAMGGVIGGLIGGCFGLIYPVVLLVLITRPNVHAALNPRTTPPPLTAST